MKLKITDLKAGTVQANYEWTFVRVYAGELSGTGEAFPAPQLEGVVQEYAPLVIGEDAFNLNRIMDKLRWASVPSGTYGISSHAFSAIEIAILDLLGKSLNVPVYALLGGKMTDKVRVYVDTHSGKGLEAMSRVVLPSTPLWMRELGVNPHNSEAKPVHGRAGSMVYTDEYSHKAYRRERKR